MVLTHRAGSLASFKARRTPPARPGATGRGLSIEFSKIGHSGSLRRRGRATEVVQPDGAPGGADRFPSLRFGKE